MTKSIAISSLVLGIAIFAASIGFITSSSHPVKRTNTVVLDEVTVHGDIPVKTQSIEIFYNPKIGKKQYIRRSNTKRTGMTIGYNHILEQGGSPMNRTVRVIENL
jgi:hypothetical protein